MMIPEAIANLNHIYGMCAPDIQRSLDEAIKVLEEKEKAIKVLEEKEKANENINQDTV